MCWPRMAWCSEDGWHLVDEALDARSPFGFGGATSGKKGRRRFGLFLLVFALAELDTTTCLPTCERAATEYLD